MDPITRPDPEHQTKAAALAKSYLGGVTACPALVHAGHPALRRRATEISAQDTAEDTFRRLKDALSRYRAATGVGRGLAAPQIGISSRAFVTYLDDEWRCFLNPRVVTKYGKTLYRESCLSCGPVSVDVLRASWVMLEWHTPDTGALRNELFEGFAARLVLHELDHLDGVLCVDVGQPGTLNLRTEDPLKEELRLVD
jgi:peptide deformylase